jgi:hypothetical protein
MNYAEHGHNTQAQLTGILLLYYAATLQDLPHLLALRAQWLAISQNTE